MEALDEVDILVSKQTEEKEKRASELNALNHFLSSISALPELQSAPRVEEAEHASKNLNSSSTSDEMSTMATREISLETNCDSEKMKMAKEKCWTGETCDRSISAGSEVLESLAHFLPPHREAEASTEICMHPPQLAGGQQSGAKTLEGRGGQQIICMVERNRRRGRGRRLDWTGPRRTFVLTRKMRSRWTRLTRACWKAGKVKNKCQRKFDEEERVDADLGWLLASQ
eukprot:760819-Hanusia_phi.AAC.2